MKKKKRTPTLCEWALGFNVEDYLDQQDRRQRRQRNPQQRFCVEVSTDDESEEDSLKITYPRSSANGNNGNNGNGNASGVKKVRFERGPQPKSVMRRTDSEQSDSDTSGSTKKGSGRSSVDSPRSYGGKKKSSSDSFDVDSSGQGQMKKGNKKTNSSDTDSSDSCEECKRRSEGNADEFQSQKGTNKSGKKERNKKKRAAIEVSEEGKGDNEASDNDEDGNRQTNKKNKDFDSRVDQGSNGGKGQKSKGKGGNQDQSKTPANDAESQGGSKKKKGQAGGKIRPEATISPGMRRPNLIMPVSAQVLQVEHAIEGVEDPRPNAFHDGEHGVVRVYHGPAYGNPYGVLYPRRHCSDAKQGSLPLGTPHPLINPYFQGFARSAHGEESHDQGQNPRDAVPITSVPTHVPVMATAGMPQTHAPWAQDTLAGRHESQPTPAFSSAVMSGALQSDVLAKKGEKDQGWSAGISPTQSYPINVNMYSYGGRPDPWSPEGRQRYANLNKKNSSGKHDTRDIFQMMDGSLENNRGPAMYDRYGNQRGSDKGSNRGQQPGSVHPELQWSPRAKPAEAATASWVDQTGTAAGWGAGDATTETNNANGKDATGEAWSRTWDQGSTNGNNGQPNNTMNGSTTDTNDWAILPDMGGSNHSGSSKGSKRSNRSGGQQGADNNVGPPPGGAASGSSTAQDTWGNDQSWSQPNGTNTESRMPGAWGADSGNGDRSGGGGGGDFTWNQTTPADTGGFSWGDTSAAQGAQW